MLKYVCSFSFHFNYKITFLFYFFFQVEDLETTLKPDGVSFNVVADAQISELQKKIELLEVQLTMERLLLQDQRAANARQQQQVIKLN